MNNPAFLLNNPAFLSRLDGLELRDYSFAHVQISANYDPLFRKTRHFSQIKWNEWEDYHGETHQASGKYIFALPDPDGFYMVVVPDRFLKRGGVWKPVLRELWDARGRLHIVLRLLTNAMENPKQWKLLMSLQRDAYKMVDDAFSKNPELSQGLRRYLAVRKLSGLMNPGLQVVKNPNLSKRLRRYLAVPKLPGLMNPDHQGKNTPEVVDPVHQGENTPDMAKNPRLQGRDNMDLVTCGVVGDKIYLKPSEHHMTSSSLADYWVIIRLPCDDLEEGVPQDLMVDNDSPPPEPDEVPNEFWAALNGVPNLKWISGKRYAWFFGGLRELQEQRFSSSKVKKIQKMRDYYFRRA